MQLRIYVNLYIVLHTNCSVEPCRNEGRKVPHRRQCREEASQIAEITTEFFFEFYQSSSHPGKRTDSMSVRSEEQV